MKGSSDSITMTPLAEAIAVPEMLMHLFEEAAIVTVGQAFEYVSRCLSSAEDDKDLISALEAFKSDLEALIPEDERLVLETSPGENGVASHPMGVLPPEGKSADQPPPDSEVDGFDMVEPGGLDGEQ